MRVRLLAGLSGPAYSLGPGDTREFPREEAIRLIEAGYAAPADGKMTETATLPVAPEVRHQLDHDGDGRPGGSLPAAERDVCDHLRAEYERITGSPADRRWGEARLRKEIEERK